VGLIVASVVLLLWAGTRPGYDPYGWLVWGYQTLHGTLDLAGAPSWKPLPYLFTVPYALAGRFSLWLWMVTAVSVSLAGCVFVGRIAHRVIVQTIADPTERADGVAYASLIAAVVAAGALLAIEDYMHYILSAQSDPMIVTFCLAAIDCHLCGRRRWAFWLGVLGSLGRPEAWPFLGIYSIWLWFKVPSSRWMLAAGWGVIAFMWFGIPWITNGRPNIAGQLARHSPRALRDNKITGTIGRFTELQFLPIWLAAIAATALAALRRNRFVLVLAAGTLVWVIVEIAFALHGFPALPRYMFEAGGVVAVLAGVGAGWSLLVLPTLNPRIPRSAGVVIVAALAVSLLPGLVNRVRAEHHDLTHERGRATEIAWLATTIDGLGGYQRVRACGEPVTTVEFASTLAWLTHLDVDLVGYVPAKELRRRHHPIVLFTPGLTGGWTVRPVHTRRAQRSQCARLQAVYMPTPSHPAGSLIRT
jgi:hypothetical protein